MITNHVTSLELSKQLYEAGITKNGEYEFWWLTDGSISNLWGKDNRGSCPAPLSSELGELLPKDASWYTESYAGVWYAREVEIVGNIINTIRKIEADTEANARAKMLLYLKEKEII